MQIDELVKKLEGLGYAQIGHGPKHPLLPDIAHQDEMQEFLAEYPWLASDQGYVDFLERYSAAVISWPNEELDINIYGFSDFTLHLLYSDEPLEFMDTFFNFAEVTTKTIPGSQDHADLVGLAFAFEMTGKQRQGIYRCIVHWGDDADTVPYIWYCGSFLEWLEDLVSAQGRLF